MLFTSYSSWIPISSMALARSLQNRIAQWINTPPPPPTDTEQSRESDDGDQHGTEM